MKRWSRKPLALLGTLVMSAAFVISGSAAANAASDWEDYGTFNNWRITRTIDPTSFSVGEIVTAEAQIKRSGSVANLYTYKDLHPECLTYVDGSARIGGQPFDPQIKASDPASPGMGFTRWSGDKAIWSSSGPLTFTVDYLVTSSCARNTNLASTAHVSGTLGGNQNFAPSAFNGGPAITVQKDATSVALAADPASAVVDQTVTFTATTSGIGDGETVTISGDGVGSNTATVTGNKATFTRTFAATGDKTVMVNYAGSAIANPATPASATVTVGKTQTQLSVAAGIPAMLGAPVPLTATSTGIADGQSVEFLVNSQPVGTATVAGGTATFNGWEPATAGAYTIQSRYAGSSTVAASSSTQVSVTVIDPIQLTSTTLAVNPAPVPGQASTLTATVVDGHNGDSVEFANNGAVVGTGTVVDGVAAFNWTPGVALANQPYSLTARYVGSPGYAESISAPVAGTVGLVQTTISAVTAPGTATVGTSIPLAANVTGGAAGQMIEFRNGSTVLCSVTLSSGGAATCYWTPTETGDYQVTAHYPGTSITNPAASPSATALTVQASQSSIELNGPATATIGQPITLTAETNGIADGETVVLQVDGSPAGTAQVSGGEASFQWTPAAAGSYELRVSYAGSATVAGSQSDPLVVTVGLAQTQTSAVTASAGPVTGQPVSLSATVTGGTAGAVVEFRNGATILCTDQIDAAGAASCPWTPVEIGSVAVTAFYLGDAATAASQSPAPTSITVGQGQVAAPTALVVTPAAPTTADAVTVSGQAPAGAEVSVYISTRECVATAGAGGAFSCELGTLPAGQNEINAVATLNGVLSQAATIGVTVSKAVSTVALIGPASVKPGQAAQLELSTSGIADGQSVDIVVGGVVVGTATVSGGEATYLWTPAVVGSFTVRAAYGGSATATPAQSNDLTITVDATATQTSRVTASSSGVSVGQPVTLSAAVSNGTEGARVEFRGGATVLCDGLVAADGTVSCAWTPTAAGTVNVIAHYPGDAVSSPSQSARATTVAVGKTASTVGLTASSPVEVGGNVRFTVTTTGIAEGQTVDITVGGAVVGSPTVTGGQATFTWTAPVTAGTVTATAAYAGSGTVAASESGPVSIDVGVASSSTSTVIAAGEATVGEPVALSATVTGGTAGATVEFRDGTTVLCTGPLTAAGTAGCDWTPQAVGTVNAIAHYPGDTATAASQSATATTIAVSAAPDTEAPAAPTGIVVAPQPVTAGQRVTVTGVAEAGSTVKVMVDGQQVCQAQVVGGAFTCEFAATSAMDGQSLTVTATDAAGNASGPADGGVLKVDEVVDPTEPTVTLTPAQPVVGTPVTIAITGDAGEEVVILAGTTEVCRTTIGGTGTGTCQWTPGAEGAVMLQITVGDQTVEKTVTVRPADDDGTDGGSGSLDMGSLTSILGSASGSLGSLGS